MTKVKRSKSVKSYLIISVIILIIISLYLVYSYYKKSSIEVIHDIVLQDKSNSDIQLESGNEVSQAEYIFLAREKLAQSKNVNQEDVFVEEVEPVADIDAGFECGREIPKKEGIGYKILLYLNGQNYNYRAFSNEVFACELN
jgi:hypothetical protein